MGFPVFVLSLLFLSCGDAFGRESAPNSAFEVMKFSNGFTVELFQVLNEEHENLVFSPFGFASNIFMLLEGASGETATQIQETFQFNNESLGKMRNGFAYYYDIFEANKKDSEAAGSYNKIVVKKDVLLLPEYKDLMTMIYRANITEASDNRTGLELHSDVGILSHWQDYERLPVYVFLSHETAAPFYLRTSSGSSTSRKEILVPMIPQVGVFRNGYDEKLGCSAVELLFEAKTVSLLLLIPDQPDGVHSVIEKLPRVSIPYLLESLTESEVEVSMPQVAFVNPMLDFTPFLKKKGIKKAFDPETADFSQASSERELYLKSLTQSSYFTSSFSSIKSVAEGLPKLGPKELRRKRNINRLSANHPFLFFVIFRETGLILLAGKVESPTQTP
ncbi:serpin B8-like [Hetaerina americana]|uniref:serpin B8-like n=1 Tax=Hetaerina americana TaxID=62018 RepID=UPI003A7F3427